MVNLPREGRNVDFSRRMARWWLFWRTITIGPIDEASFAREQLQRTLGLAMGSEGVVVQQVEAYEEDLVDFIFADTSLTFSEFVWGLLDFGLSTFSFFRG